MWHWIVVHWNWTDFIGFLNVLAFVLLTGGLVHYAGKADTVQNQQKDLIKLQQFFNQRQVLAEKERGLSDQIRLVDRFRLDVYALLSRLAVQDPRIITSELQAWLDTCADEWEVVANALDADDTSELNKCRYLLIATSLAEPPDDPEAVFELDVDELLTMPMDQLGMLITQAGSHKRNKRGGS